MLKFTAHLKFILCVFTLIFCTNSLANPPKITASKQAFATAKALGKGVNLGWYDSPLGIGDWGPPIDQSHIDAIASGGLSTIRLPVRWSNHASLDASAKLDMAFVKSVEKTVDAALAKNLYVVMNMHNYRQLDGDKLDEIYNVENAEKAVAPEVLEQRFVNLWRQIATHFAKKSPKLIFELYNEPHEKQNKTWNALFARALKVVRKTNPKRLVMVGPTQWNNAEALKDLRLPPDRHVIVTIHNYMPFDFTHQGAEWVEPVMPIGIKCCTAEQLEQINAPMEMAYQWGLAHGYPIWLGEFGAYDKADLASRIAFNQAMLKAAATRNINWAYWEFHSDFGFYDPKAKAWRTDLAKSLGVNTTNKP